jgi:hypothetical protein
MAFATTVPAPAEEVGVVQIFTRTWSMVARHWRVYAVLTTLFGVGPMMLASAVLRTDPQALGSAPPAVRLIAMGFFLAGDVVLWAILARMTLAAIEGRAVTVRDSFAVPRRQWGTLFVLVAMFDVPNLLLNLAAGLIARDLNTGLMFYGVRFALGMAQLAFFGCATAILMREGGTVASTLLRGLQLTRGSRFRIALFFIVFFMFKVMGPFLMAYTVFDWIERAAPHAYAAQAHLAVGIASTILWNALCCALSLSSALIYADLLRLRDGVDLTRPA